VVTASASELRDGLRQHGLQHYGRRVMNGSEARVFMLGGDLIVGVIGITTLGLAHLHIILSFSGLVS
jgi:hypothetical protein